MSIALIHDIRAAEQAAEEIREAAAREARDIVKGVEEALAAFEREENAKTRESVAQQLAEAKKRAEIEIHSIEARRSAERQALRQVAEGRVSRTAQSIFERIVGNGNR